MSINHVSGVRADISQMIERIREISNKSKVFSEQPAMTGSSISSVSPFNNVMSVAKNAVSQVNQLQMQTEQIKDAFISGDRHVSMSQVVVASQKSKLAFEGLVIVRNKLLDAYKDIMNMPI